MLERLPMKQKLKVKLQLYGIFHNYYKNQKEVILELSEQSNFLFQLREALCQDIKIKNPDLDEDNVMKIIDSSVFVKNDIILDTNNYRLTGEETLAILPPVCGG
jgi:molybdopterin converting factor small subunit